MDHARHADGPAAEREQREPTVATVAPNGYALERLLGRGLAVLPFW